MNCQPLDEFLDLTRKYATQDSMRLSSPSSSPSSAKECEATRIERGVLVEKHAEIQLLAERCEKTLQWMEGHQAQWAETEELRAGNAKAEKRELQFEALQLHQSTHSGTLESVDTIGELTDSQEHNKQVMAVRRLCFFPSGF